MAGRRAIARSERIDVPWHFVHLAWRRTEFLFRHMHHGDMPMRMVLACAWSQGISDAVDAIDHQQQTADLLAAPGLHADQSCTGEGGA